MTFTSRVLALVTPFFALAFGQEDLSSNNVTNPENYLNFPALGLNGTRLNFTALWLPDGPILDDYAGTPRCYNNLSFNFFALETLTPAAANGIDVPVTNDRALVTPGMLPLDSPPSIFVCDATSFNLVYLNLACDAMTKYGCQANFTCFQNGVLEVSAQCGQTVPFEEREWIQCPFRTLQNCSVLEVALDVQEVAGQPLPSANQEMFLSNITVTIN